MKTKNEETYIALLRGVNVGGNNKLPMKSLSGLCEAQGCCAVRTYIQSGNVVFRASAKVAAGFPDKLKAQIKQECGFETTVILRTTAELRAAAENNPFLTPDVDTKFLYVMFLASEPNLTDVVKLNPVCEGEEAFSLRGSEIFLYLPNGAGRSKMASYAYDKILRTVGSTRNWQTVQKLLALCQETSLSG
jgi:uncharacterized protein (DUF1697 family)